MDDDRPSTLAPPPTLPAAARLPLNRCNLPAVILGSLTYQAHPVPLELDGIRDFHADLFRVLDLACSHAERARCFQEYMSAHFLLDHLDEAGLAPGRARRKRANANYLRLVRGWSFDADGLEAAVLKRWVESRFGLVARYHRGQRLDPAGEAYAGFMAECTRGLYGTNALEAQLDLLYTYGQYELALAHPNRGHLTLYRGINRIGEHDILAKPERGCQHLLLNNLSSFTCNRDRADEFGDYILTTEVPVAKIFFYNRLLPDMLRGEDEYVVIGGVYAVRIGSL